MSLSELISKQLLRECAPVTPPDSHEWNLRAIELQSRARIVFDLLRQGASSPDLLYTSVRLLEAPERAVFCREIQKLIEQSKK